MLQFKYHYLLRIRENIFNSLRVIKFNRPKWEYFRSSLIFKLSKTFFVFKKNKYSLLLLNFLNIRYILSVYLKKRLYFKYIYYLKILQQLKYKLFYKIKNFMYYSKFFLKQLKNTTRSYFISLFEMKIFIVLYRLGWFLKLNVSYYFFQLGIIIYNFIHVTNPYVVLKYGDYVSIDYKFYNYIYSNLLSRTSFLILPYYNTFLKRRKRWFKRRFFFKEKLNQVSKFLVLNQGNLGLKRYRFYKFRYYMMNQVLSKSRFFKKMFIYKLYKFLFVTQNNSLLNFNSSLKFLYLFRYLDLKSRLDFFSMSFLNVKLNFNGNNFISLQNIMTIILKYFLFQVKYTNNFFKFKRYFWFKKFFFVDRFLFLFPHYFVINFNSLELLVIEDINSINYNKSCYFFRNMISDF